MTKLNVNKKQPKKFWREVNNLLKGKSTDAVTYRLLNLDTNELVLCGEEADYINNFYIDVGAKVHHSNVILDSYPVDSIPHNGNVLEFDPFTIDEIIKLATNIEIDKSSGIPEFNSRIFKDVLQSLPGVFCKMYNKSITEGIFPNNWSSGLVIPIPKSGSLQYVTNWRPISILPIQGKIMEHLVHSRLMTYLLGNQIINQHQYGFMPGRSTVHAIFEVTKYLYDNINKGNYCGSVFIDISKAFDSVYHPRLLLKLEQIGLHNILLLWFKSYLTRTQRVLFNKVKSDKAAVFAGVPQGSVLGPTLFLIYINDLFNATNGVKITMYADDCVVYYASNRVETVRNTLERNLSYIDNWCISNRLRMNSNKTKVMYVSTKYRLDRLPRSSLKCGNNIIGHVESYVYLGINLDAEMSLNLFASHLYNRIQIKIFTLSKIRKYIDKNTANAIYKQTILPIFDYGGFLLDSCTQKQKDDLQKLQNKGLRIINGFKLANAPGINVLHTMSNMLSLRQRREKQLLHLMLWYSKYDVNLQKRNRRTRLQGKINFNVLPLKTRKYINSPMNRGNILWNKLSRDEQTTFSNQMFKIILDGKYKVYEA